MLRQFRHIWAIIFYTVCSIFYRFMINSGQFRNDFNNRRIVIRDSNAPTEIVRCSMGRLSTHVLDTVRGKPAAGVVVTLDRLTETVWHHVVEAKTNTDGRTDQPILSGEAFVIGTYMLSFHIGAYFKRVEKVETDFLDVVPIRFTITDPTGHYHVPLLATPWSYSTYRGS
jgi:5-hydroxyisourate hydrolase